MTISPVKDQQPTRFWTPDVLRGLAIFGVVSFHTLPLDLPADSSLSWVRYGGPVGVSFFFVLSGFSVHLSQLRKDASQPFSWQQFLWQRLNRLYPPYLAAILVAIATNIIWAALRGRPLFSFAPTPGDLISHLLLIHTLHPDTFFGIIPAFWFIGVLFHLYCLYPCFRCFIQRWGTTTALIMVLAVTLTARYLSHTLITPSTSLEMSSYLQNNAPQRWFEWCLGAWIAIRILHKEPPPRWFSGLTGLLFVVYLVPYASPVWLSDSLLGVCLGSLLWHLLSWETQWQLNFLWRPWSYLGLFSYSIYLLHQIFVPYVRSALDPSPFAPMPTFLLVLTGVLLLTLPISIALHYLLEKPLIWRSRFHERG